MRNMKVYYRKNMKITRNVTSRNIDEQEEEGCRKYTDDEGSMETDTTLSEFPAFADNNARQSGIVAPCAALRKKMSTKLFL